MNAEIKDCIESLLGEFKRANLDNLRKWINESEGNQLLVKAICLIEQEAMLRIANLTKTDKEQEPAILETTDEDEQENNPVLSQVLSMKGAEVKEEHAEFRCSVADILKTPSGEDLSNCIHYLSHGLAIGVKKTLMGWFVNKWNSDSRSDVVFTRLIFTSTDDGCLIYLRFDY